MCAKVLAVIAALLTAVSCMAEKSPRGEATCEFADGKKVVITYKRPNMRGRKIFGGVVPWDEFWRTGDPRLVTDANLQFGSNTSVPACKCYVYTVPGQTQLEVNCIWGT